MERLTTRIDGYAYGKSGIKRLSKDYHRGSFECTALIERLAEYEDLEEQGLLLRLPCKVGGHVFQIESYICCSECDNVKKYYIADIINLSLSWIVLNIEQFGKTVFLTYEEAEKKLKELQKEGAIHEQIS